ncbi:bifunctional diaminohydroxyphosphoribosylaminopyrimidine deaminase/5-amino-6-(5-phosphoribosylamino)uracil reductase RibD [Arthrobacter sp. H14]|uniref:bifunctional diaminohydroxyphosphoribosylaminopyrimidine deaminase/5-amino-6-(5-phosphoribosylamino)uracil reductase RibD n=1 Tax=Arthrobacter sp. H14 TaxID=1312959 RepID=UPI0004B5A34D|nr:bifunctional diaminohydroxyphosphoribosylaminopyrimidine deaminase/5-amino-6-(5-phosphoribosylamino)uracil reductase RibD [Arthrobacter sp. H14]
MKLQGVETYQSRSFSDPERQAMTVALELASRGVRGANPLVGAVILDSAGTVLGTGYHRGAGTPHAERDAIADAGKRGSKIEGATMVVTLEPCNHTGRTLPCTEAVIEAGIARIIYAVHDISHTASGGSETLRNAGIEVESGLLEDEAASLNRRWFDAVATARPFTTLRMAQTLDAQIAASDGTSQWISGAESRRDSHQLRARVDAILVGTGTVLADDPRLTARDQDGALAASQPLRVVMGHRDVPAGAAVRDEGGGGFVHYNSHDPRLVGIELHARGVRHLMIEGGSKVSSAFLAEGLVDEIIVYLAPTFLGRGIPALEDLGITSLSQAQHWEWDPVGRGCAVPLGRDLRLQLEPAKQ